MLEAEDVVFLNPEEGCHYLHYRKAKSSKDRSNREATSGSQHMGIVRLFFVIISYNGLIDELYNYYSAMSTVKEDWNGLQKMYDTEEVGFKKYAVSRYMWYQMVDDR